MPYRLNASPAISRTHWTIARLMEGGPFVGSDGEDECRLTVVRTRTRVPRLNLPDVSIYAPPLEKFRMIPSNVWKNPPLKGRKAIAAVMGLRGSILFDDCTRVIRFTSIFMRVPPLANWLGSEAVKVLHAGMGNNRFFPIPSGAHDNSTVNAIRFLRRV